MIGTFLISAGIRLVRTWDAPGRTGEIPALSQDDSLFLQRVRQVDSLVKSGAVSADHLSGDDALLDQRLAYQLDINQANAEALQTLPGIGPVMAKRIIAHRVQNGYFKSFGDLQQVKGIGPATIEKLQPHIVFNK